MGFFKFILKIYKRTFKQFFCVGSFEIKPQPEAKNERNSSIWKPTKRKQIFTNAHSVQVLYCNSSLSQRLVVSVMSKRTSKDDIFFRILAENDCLRQPKV